LDFGNSQRNLSHVSLKGQLLINRIICLSVLTVMESLGNNLNIPSQLIATMDDLFSNLSGTESHHVALFLGWASYIKEIETIDIIKHAEKGIKLKGIQFFKNMLDREQEQFPFNGHELNIEGYRSVVKEVISNILGLFNIRKSPFKLLKDILDSIEIVLLPSPL